MPGKVYRKVFNERTMKITDKSVDDEHGGFRKGRGFIDKIFALKLCILVKYPKKGRKLFSTYRDVYKAYNTVDKDG